MGGLFGGGTKTSTSKTERPSWLKNYVTGITNQVNSIEPTEYTNREYAGLSEDQKAYLNQMKNDPQFQNYVNNIVSQGQEGYNQLNNVYGQISDLYNQGGVSAQQIEDLTGQLYNYGDVQNAIDANRKQLAQDYATGQGTSIAQQLNMAGMGGNAGGAHGFGSADRLMKSMGQQQLAQAQQNAANQITSAAQQNAQDQATAMLTGSLSNKRAALGALNTNAQYQAGLYDQGVQNQQTELQNRMNAINQEYQDARAQNLNDYTNKQNAQQWGWNTINSKLNAVQSVNSALGMSQKTTQKAGSALGGILSAVGGAVGTVYGGPLGGAAGSALGGAIGGAAG